MLEITKTRTALAALAVAAIVAPAAGAQPIDGSPPVRVNEDARPAVMTRTVEVHSTGFDWADAGLGAAAMLSVLGLGAGAVVVGRRGQATAG